LYKREALAHFTVTLRLKQTEVRLGHDCNGAKQLMVHGSLPLLDVQRGRPPSSVATFYGLASDLDQIDVSIRGVMVEPNGTALDPNCGTEQANVMHSELMQAMGIQGREEALDHWAPRTKLPLSSSFFEREHGDLKRAMQREDAKKRLEGERCRYLRENHSLSSFVTRFHQTYTRNDAAEESCLNTLGSSLTSMSYPPQAQASLPPPAQYITAAAVGSDLCTYCGQPGHRVAHCWHRQYRN
jgi:hypothetical protein